MDNQGTHHIRFGQTGPSRWLHTNIRNIEPHIIQVEAPFMDMAAVAGAMRRPSAIVNAPNNTNSTTTEARLETGGGGRNSNSAPSDDKWEAEFLAAFWEEEKRRAMQKSSAKVRKKRVRTPEQKAIEAARKRLARAKEKETLTEAERLERNRKRRLRERMNRYRKLNKIPPGGSFPPGMLMPDMGSGSMQHMDGKQV